MKNLIIIIILTFNLSANSQILLKDEDVFGNNKQTPVINSPNNEWMIINTFNPKIGDNKHQKAYLLNKNGEKKNEFIGIVFLGFSLDSKTVIVQDLNSKAVKELSIPDLKIVDELSFRSETYDLVSDKCFWYLPQKNKLIVAKREGNSDGRRRKELISLELWDWHNKNKIRSVANVPFLENIMEIDDGQISTNNEKILFCLTDSRKNEGVKYRNIVLETESLKIISTIDLSSFDDEMKPKVSYAIKLSEKGDKVFSPVYINFDQKEQTHNNVIHIWDSITGNLSETLKFGNNLVEKMYVNNDNEIIMLGSFNSVFNQTSNAQEVIRKWDSKFKKILNIHRESWSNMTLNFMSNDGDIYFWDKESKILTPFNTKTWSKGKTIKL
jgi:hypothetical protein